MERPISQIPVYTESTAPPGPFAVRGPPAAPSPPLPQHSLVHNKPPGSIEWTCHSEVVLVSFPWWRMYQRFQLFHLQKALSFQWATFPAEPSCPSFWRAATQVGALPFWGPPSAMKAAAGRSPPSPSPRAVRAFSCLCGSGDSRAVTGEVLPYGNIINSSTSALKQVLSRADSGS